MRLRVCLNSEFKYSRSIIVNSGETEFFLAAMLFFFVLQYYAKEEIRD